MPLIFSAFVSFGNGYKSGCKMPPKERIKVSLEHAVPSGPDGFSGDTQSRSVKKRKQSINQSIVPNECINSSNAAAFGVCDGVNLLFLHPLNLLINSREYYKLYVTNDYEDIGDCNCVCSYCGAMFWYEERLRVSTSSLNYSRCCEGGRISLPREETPPQQIIGLLSDKHFMENIRAYNQMFSMASYGAHIDDLINNGAIVYGFDDDTRTDYDLIIECKGGTPQRVNKLHSSYMSLHFPLLFVFGQPGYHPGLTLRSISSSSSNKKKKLTMNTFYSYQLHDRCKQQDIRNEYLSGLYDALDRGDHYRHEVGSRTILPASFTGGIEIKRYLSKYSHLTSNDRAEIISRVFHIKVSIIHDRVSKKRFTPLSHNIMDPFCVKLFRTTDVNWYISAEFPDLTKDPKGFKVVSKMMIHGPSGLVNKSAPCMQYVEISPSGIFNRDNVCLKRFPKIYNETTYFDKDGFVHYRRCNSVISVDKGICKLDKEYVVPYNPHIPRPLGSTSFANASRSSNVDEIQNFIDARFLCPHEAVWRIYNSPIHYRELAVQILSVHLEDMQNSLDGRHLKYLDFPSEYVWVGNEKRWKRRFNLNKPSIG
ncbi:uncharacterized protein [Rutidosis leptorrhynchoides]|uniref:uncharacterized protein n=1 Tax=Rutidosis leptorrhynchoides TaxID=125765 RepID=UPI003A995E04